MMRFAARGVPLPRRPPRSSSSTTRRSSTRRRARRRRPRRAMAGRRADPLGAAARPRRPPGGDPRRPRARRSRSATTRPRARRSCPGVLLALVEARASSRPASPSGSTRCSERARRGDASRSASVELSLLRPREPEALLDEEAFADDEFMPYWAELWPAGLALARALPPSGSTACAWSSSAAGSACPSLVAAARGAEVTAIDWAADAVELLHGTPPRTGSPSTRVHADWRALRRLASTSRSPPTCSTRSGTSSRCSSCCRGSRRRCCSPSPAGRTQPTSSAAPASVAVDEVADRVYRLVPRVATARLSRRRTIGACSAASSPRS